MKRTKFDSVFIAEVGLLIAVELAMRLVGLGRVPVGPLNMSFLTVPIAIAAMLLGPAAGAITGAVFGLASFYDALSGASLMTGAFLQISPLNTFILCVGMRILVGVAAAYLFRLFQSLDRSKTVCYLLGAVATPLLNTLFFMGYIVLVFYQTEYIQNLVGRLGVTNPIAFVIALVGVQGLIEAVVCGVAGSIVAKTLAHFLARSTVRRQSAV